MAKVNIDMWYGDKIESADRIDIFFHDNYCEYRGNIYKNGIGYEVQNNDCIKMKNMKGI